MEWGSHTAYYGSLQSTAAPGEYGSTMGILYSVPETDKMGEKG